MAEKTPDELFGFCGHCQDIYSEHPEGKCCTSPDGFKHGGFFKIEFQERPSIVVDTLYQARLIANAHHGDIVDVNGKPVPRR